MTSVNCEDKAPRAICGASDLFGFTPEPMVPTFNEGAVVVIFFKSFLCVIFVGFR